MLVCAVLACSALLLPQLRAEKGANQRRESPCPAPTARHTRLLTPNPYPALPSTPRTHPARSTGGRAAGFGPADRPPDDGDDGALGASPGGALMAHALVDAAGQLGARLEPFALGPVSAQIGAAAGGVGARRARSIAGQRWRGLKQSGTDRVHHWARSKSGRLAAAFKKRTAACKPHPNRRNPTQLARSPRCHSPPPRRSATTRRSPRATAASWGAWGRRPAAARCRWPWF